MESQGALEDERNIGIEADELVGLFCGAMLRRVTYRDPADGKLYVFMTSEMSLPPGLIAFLYKLRWDIEKVFDGKKNKLHEKKAWATSPTARCQQAHFTALAHNLMVLLELHLAARVKTKSVGRKSFQIHAEKPAVHTVAEMSHLRRDPVRQRCRDPQALHEGLHHMKFPHPSLGK